MQLAKASTCPYCGSTPLEPRSGRYGEYLHCPRCDKNVSLRKLQTPEAEPIAQRVDVPCPKCGQAGLEARHGRYGPYYHCAACGANTSAAKLKAGG